ncbi:MAG: serine hydrolase [Pyrinomonadaceae bacterium]
MSAKYLTSVALLVSLLVVSLPAIGLAQTTAAPTVAAAQQYTKALAEIEAKVEARRKELGIPGMSLVIVKDDQIIYMKGLGLKDFEKKIAVTPDTQFGIGSATKAFTALSVLMSQDDGKLSLDDSPKKTLPYFKMYDADTDKNINIRDLLSHSSGLNRTDLAMMTGKLTRAELVQVAAQARPTAKLREKWQYQNIMYAAAGEIVAQVQKMPWEDFVPKRIFAPLGMRNSNMSIKGLEAAKDFSLAYNYNFDTKETQKLPFRGIGPVAPAGSINSSARDMAEWLRFVLKGGTVGGKRIVSEASFAEWLKPQTKMGGTSSYALGWFLQDWNGMRVVQHGGNIDGFNSLVAMIPEKKLGFVMLTNVTGSSLGGELMPIIWSNLVDRPKGPDAPKLTLTEMQQIAGKYRLASPIVDIEIKVDGDKLVMAVPGQPQAALVSTGPRQFKPLDGPDGFSAKFIPEQDDATEMQLTQPNGVFTFARINADGTVAQKAAAGTDPARELIGKYTRPNGNGTVEISEANGKINFNIEGQMPYALIEKSKDIYAMSPLPETYSMRSKRDAAGKLLSVVVNQPEGEFEFKLVTAHAKPLITVEELRTKTVEAAGGEGNLRKVTSRVIESETDMENQGIIAKATSWQKAPNRIASETSMIALGKEIATGREYFDGTGGGQTLSFMPGEAYTGIRLADVRRGADFYSMLDWKTGYKKVTVTGTRKLGEDETYVVAFEPVDGTTFREFYSTKTFLLIRREGVIASSTSSQQLPYTTTLSDYRDVDGIKLPFKTVTENIANGTMVTTIKSIKHNVLIDDKVFAPMKK